MALNSPEGARSCASSSFLHPSPQPGTGRPARAGAGRRYLCPRHAWQALSGERLGPVERGRRIQRAPDRAGGARGHAADAGLPHLLGRTALPPVVLAEKLVEIAPMEVARVYFVNSGSEANDTAIKMLWMMARGAGEPARRTLISRSMAYHGTTVASCSLNGKPYIGAFGLPLPRCATWRRPTTGETPIPARARRPMSSASRPSWRG